MKTLSIDEREKSRDVEPSPKAWVVRVGSAGTPRRRPECICLDGRSRLVLGRREDESEAPLVSSGSPERAEVADPWMSSEHAELVRVGERFELRDLGSSNGTLLFGERRSSALLADGDLFETGGTFWLFRQMIAPEGLPDRPSQDLLGSLYPPLVALGNRVRRVARTRVPVMLLGPTGTGKEVLARELHRLSGRTGAFVAINVGAMQRALVASELFGAERGAHSTADVPRLGQVRGAEGGTLLLDEIGDTPAEVQIALLRLLQESEVLPVGSSAPVRVDVRFLCATNRDVAGLVKTGELRADLFGRIKGCVLELPPLEDRREDIGLLIARFLERYGGESLTFSISAYRALLQYEWPLNVRELEKSVEMAIALAPDARIELEHLPREVAAYRPLVDKPEAEGEEDLPPDAQLEKELTRMLTIHGGNVSRVARSMGTTRQQVHRWLKRLNLDAGQYRARSE